jgi:hypothetical protein
VTAPGKASRRGSRIVVADALRVLLLATSAVLLDCASLDPIRASTCGNLVQDDDEDCDTFPATCGKPSEGPKACRLTCVPVRGQAGGCPTGWGCGVDGVCREPNDVLEEAKGPVSAAASSLLAGDFDGDGRVDVVGTPPYGSGANVRVHFFDDKGALATAVSLPPAALAVVQDFDRDGRDDVGFALDGSRSGAFGALTGRRDRSFATLLFPAFVMPERSVAIVPLSGGGRRFPGDQEIAAVLGVMRHPGGTVLASLGGDPLARQHFEVPFPVGPEALVGVPRAARIRAPSPASRCGEVIVAYTLGGRGKIAMASPCNDDPANGRVQWANDRPVTEIFDAPGGLRGMFVGRLHADDTDDVLVETDPGVILEARAEGGEIGPFRRHPWMLSLPLAAADLDGDGLVDFVFSNGIFLRSAPDAPSDAGAEPGRPPPGRFVARPRGTRTRGWGQAIVARFNSDELPDVVVSNEDALDVELLGNAGGGRFSGFVIPSDQPVRALAAADFDGDRVQDVAFLAAALPFEGYGPGVEAELVVAYGRPAGGTDPPRVVGRVPHARGLLALPNDEHPRDDLGVLELLPAEDTSKPLPTVSTTILFGSGERHAVAPLFLRDEAAIQRLDEPGKLRVWAPRVLNAGILQDKDVDVLAFAVGSTLDLTESTGLTRRSPLVTGVWIASADRGAHGGFDTFREVAPLTGRFAVVDHSDDAPGSSSVSLLSKVGDIDVPRNGVDEIITVAQAPDRTTHLTIVRPGVREDLKPEFAIPGVSVKGGDTFELGDVDGDGAPDAVVMVRTNGRRKLLVFLNDRAGSFHGKGIDVPLPGDPADDPVAVAALASGVRDDKPWFQLAIVTHTRLLTASLRRDGSAFDVVDRTASVFGNKGVTRLTGIVAGDVDGDGVPDLAVADGGAIRIIRQEAKRR